MQAVLVSFSSYVSGSNNAIRSTVHRVRAPPNASYTDGMTPDRYSIPYVRLGFPAISASSNDVAVSSAPLYVSIYTLIKRATLDELSRISPQLLIVSRALTRRKGQKNTNLLRLVVS